MKKHVKMYLDHHGYDISDFIPCRVCGKQSVDIHHIEPKGMGGRKSADNINNLIALCRCCHDDAHNNKISKEKLRSLIQKR